MRVSAAGVLPLAPAAAWAHLVSWERQARWIPDADDVRVIGTQREGVGVRIAVRTRVLSLPAFTDILEVVRWEPPRLLWMVHARFVRGTGEWRLEPLGGGRTRFTWTEDLRLPVPVVGEIALAVYAPVLRRLMRRAVERLGRDIVAGP